MIPTLLYDLPLRPSTLAQTMRVLTAVPSATRADLARAADLSPATVSRAVPVLVRAGILRELPRDSCDLRYSLSELCVIRAVVVSPHGISTLWVRPDGSLQRSDSRPYHSALTLRANLDLALHRIDRIESAERDRLFRTRNGRIRTHRTVRWPHRLDHRSARPLDVCRQFLRRYHFGTQVFLPMRSAACPEGIPTPELWQEITKELANRGAAMTLHVLPPAMIADPYDYVLQKSEQSWQTLLQILSAPSGRST